MTFKKQNELFEASLIILSLLMLCNPFYSGHYTAFIYFIVHGITFIISFILLIYSRITIKKLYSPFECRNDDISMIKEYKQFIKNKIISLVFIIIYMIIYFVVIFFEIYYFIKEKNKGKTINNKIKVEKIKNKLLNKNNDSEMGVIFN